MTTPRQLDWLKLKLIPNLGSVIFARLLRAFGTPTAALSASADELTQVKGLGSALARDIVAKSFEPHLAAHLKALERMAARIVTMEDQEYPELLRHIHAPPPLLFVQGSLAPCAGAAVAIVGARRPTLYGKKLAEALGRDLAALNICVVSGLARGIDALAHQGALQAGGMSVGVLACSLDYPYPPENLALIKEMALKGAVVSEFLIGVPPRPGLFPVRNRIISGLSQATIVVEANLRSGSLITARHALDQGREVFAVPGPITSDLSQGCHELLRQGAGLLTSVQDLLDAMPSLTQTARAAAPAAPLVPLAASLRVSAGQAGLDLPPDSANILNLIGIEPMHLDEIIRTSGLSAQTVTALLVALELEGLISQEPGRYYLRV